MGLKNLNPIWKYRVKGRDPGLFIFWGLGLLIVLSVAILYYYAKATSIVVREELPEPDVYISKFLDRNLTDFRGFISTFQGKSNLGRDDAMSVILEFEQKLIEFQSDIEIAEKVLQVDHKLKRRLKEFGLLKEFVEEDLLFIRLIKKNRI